MTDRKETRMDDLAAVRARLEPKRRTVGYVVIDHEDFRVLMDGLDAQAARLAAATDLLTRLRDGYPPYESSFPNGPFMGEVWRWLAAGAAGEGRADECNA
jgi:hypothetical protein